MTTNIELQQMIDKLGIKNFRGVIMRDEFATLDKPLETEYGIYNVDDSKSNGTHWCCWAKQGSKWYHFCSYGADAPSEFIQYSKSPVMSSTFQIQEFSEDICGEYCVLVIYLMSEGIDFEDAVLSLINAN